MSDTTNELLGYWKWLSSLREPVREAFLKNWDETGRPLNDHPVRNLLISLCELNDGNGFDAFKADANAALVGKMAIDEKQLEDTYVLFMAGAIWGTKQIQKLMREEFANRPSTANP